MKLMISLFMVLLASTVYAAPTQLCFTPSPDTDIASYRVDYGMTKGGPYTISKNIGKPAVANGLICATFTTIGGLTQDRLYYATVKAIDTQGQASLPTFEVQFNPNPICEYSLTAKVVKDSNGAVTIVTPVFTPTKVCP